MVENMPQSRQPVPPQYTSQLPPAPKKRGLWIWVLIAILIIGSGVIICVIEGNPNTKEEIAEEPVKTETREEPATTTQTEEPAIIPTPTEPPATTGQKNALRKAKDYLSIMSFSYTGLVEQLEYEGFTHEEAVYAVDRCGADWNEQAAKKAKSYMEMMSFSRSGLIDQLKFEGFTQEQAEYGARAVGY